MPRLARFILPGVAHPVTQRGNGRQQTFFGDADYAAYRDPLARHCTDHGVGVWSWVLMPNHVPLIPVPGHEDGLRAALSRVHRAHAGRIPARERRSGHFGQGRFGCVALDEAPLLGAPRYVARNPVRARLARRAQDWRWASVHAPLDPAKADGVTATGPVLDRIPGFAAPLRSGEDALLSQTLRQAETAGRPLGDGAFMASVAAAVGATCGLASEGRGGPRWTNLVRCHRNSVIPQFSMNAARTVREYSRASR